MRIKQIAKIRAGQDGAIFGSELFRLNSCGDCCVYDLSSMPSDESACIDIAQIQPKAVFKLERHEEIVPHSNAVCFGAERYCESDEYPILYTNIYNNYANAQNKLIGVCLAYRLQRSENGFSATPVQMICIGFCEKPELWRAGECAHGVRPYGNFIVDCDTRSYWAFVMRSEELGTRYFKFHLPSVHDGELDEIYGMNKVVLEETDIIESFDLEYHRFIQGAALCDGVIYSTEGFYNDPVNRPAIRLIDLRTKTEKYFDITKLGYLAEPEFIDFYNGQCLYGDAEGNLYNIDFS